MDNKTKKNVATVRVKTDIIKPMDIDLVAEHIKSVAENFDNALKSGLHKRAIAMLIHDQIPSRYKVKLGDVLLILEFAPAIKNYLTK